MKHLLLSCLLLAALPAAAQTVDATFASPTSLYQPGALYAMGPAQADGKRLLAGNFTRVNSTATSGLVRLDASGALDQSFSQNVGQVSNVYSISAGRNGQYLLGSQGGGIAAGGLSRNEVLLLNADGTGDASFDAGTGPSIFGSTSAGYGYSYLMQPDGKVLVGGYFDAYSGTAAGGVVRLTATGSPDASFSVGTGINDANGSGFVQTLAVQSNGQILVGGDFTMFAGQPATSLVRLNADGTRDASLPAVLGADSYVSSLTIQPDGRILVTGSLKVNGSYVSLVRLLASGALDTSFKTDAITITYLYDAYQTPLVLQPDGKIVLIGIFTSSGSPSNLVRLNTDGSSDQTFFAQNVATNLDLIGLQSNGRLLLGSPAVSNIFNGTFESTLAQYTSAGALDDTYAPKIQAAAAIGKIQLLNDGTLLAGGSFTEWNGQPVHRLAHLSAIGTLDAAFSARAGVLPGSTTALATQADGGILVGTTAGLRRLAANGTPDASFPQTINNSVIALAMQPDNKILVAGSFYISTGGNTYAGLLRLTNTGIIDPSFVLKAGSLALPVDMQALLLQPDGKVVLGARYRSNTTYVTRYESTGAQDASFTPALLTGGSFSYVYSLARQADGKLLVGGNFTQAGGVARAGLARLTTTGAVDASFALPSQFYGSVNSITVQPNNRILLGGVFTPAGSSVGANLTRVLPDGQLDATFATTVTPNSRVHSILVQPDGAIVIAGAFSQLNNQPRLALARITAPNVLALPAPAPAPAPTAARTSAWPVPAHELLHVAPDPAAQPQLAELLDALGRPVLRLPLTSAAEFTLPTLGLPAGLYLLRLTYATGAVSRQVAVE